MIADFPESKGCSFFKVKRSTIAVLAALGGLILSIAWGAVGCRTTAPPPIHVTDDGASPPDTTLGPDDVFDVRVYGEKDLSGTYRVASDGTIDYPLLGTVRVDGQTPGVVAKAIEKGLIEGGFLKRPQVSIFVKEYNSKKISVFGQVKQPGTFPYQDGMSIVEAISIAGGFTAMARTNDTTVTRVTDNKKIRFRVPVEEIGQGTEKNFVLRAGDIVFVPERIF
ncbi:MAG: polysaccharide biosynthesis/export family protein [Myxococcota bacterium]|nr:polysaccharide biosynthesis/export family protein [Myxococcota bacterium]